MIGRNIVDASLLLVLCGDTIDAQYYNCTSIYYKRYIRCSVDLKPGD